MKFNVIGESYEPKILCIHPLLGNSKSVTEILNCIKGNYMFIVPDISAHGSDNEEFISAEKEADSLNKYLIENGFTDISLTIGFSMGSLIVLNALINRRISFGEIVLEGAPLYRLGKVMQKIVASSYLGARKNADKKPHAYFKQVTADFGEEFAEKYGEITRKKFITMSDSSIKNAALTCSYFNFPEFSEEVQKTVHFRYGSLEGNMKSGVKNVKKYYPYSEIIIEEGRKHCEYPFKEKELYAEMLSSFANLQMK